MILAYFHLSVHTYFSDNIFMIMSNKDYYRSQTGFISFDVVIYVGPAKEF